MHEGLCLGQVPLRVEDLPLEASAPEASVCAEADHRHAEIDRAIVAEVILAVVARVARVGGGPDDHAEERLVTTGQMEGELIEATSGLKAGERVIVGGVERLSDGARVKAGS